MDVTDTFFSPACWRDELWQETRSPLHDISLEDSNAGRLNKRVEGAERAYKRMHGRVLVVMPVLQAACQVVSSVAMRNHQLSKM
jgi:hypothetical protein